MSGPTAISLPVLKISCPVTVFLRSKRIILTAMADISSGAWIGFGIFLAFILILIEVQLHTIASLLREVRDHLLRGQVEHK